MSEHIKNRFEWIAKLLLYVIAVLLPIGFLPLSLPFESGRAMIFGFLVFTAILFWFIEILIKNKVRIQYSLFLYAGVLMFAVFGLSTFFSGNPAVSFFYASPVAERMFTIVEAFLLMLLAANVIISLGDVKKIWLALTGTACAAALVNAVQLIGNVPVWQKIFSGASGANFNAVGTQNAVALFYAILLAANLAFFTKARTKMEKYFLTFCLAVFFINIFLINYFFAWIAVLVTSILLIGIGFKNTAKEKGEIRWRHAAATLLAALAIVMLVIRTPLLRGINISPEVSPSFTGTIAIAKNLFQADAKAVLFGSGPGTFGLDWLRFKNAAINQTPAWQIRFNQGFSWISTLFPTTGVLGFLSAILFFGMAFFVFLRGVLLSREDDGVATGLFLAFSGFLLAVAIYPLTVLFLFGLFFMMGLLMYVLSEKTNEARETLTVGHTIDDLLRRDSFSTETTAADLPKSGSFTDIYERVIRCQGPWAMFTLSLVTIFAFVVCAVALYTQATRLRAEVFAAEGISEFNRGATDQAVRSLLESTRLSGDDYYLYELLLQVRAEEIRKLIERAGRGEDVRQEFQQTVSTAVQESQHALSLESHDPDLWRTQGALYELLIPLIPGSERFAFDSYTKGTELDPINPSAYYDLGRAKLTYADYLLQVINQGQPNRDQQVKERLAVLEDAVKAFERAVDAKSDFATAHFLMAQAAMRMGNTEKAIKSVENAKLAAPFDIGVAFQLGLLYYQSNDMNRARTEFERAVAINDNYSNARYFLGLIYDKQGDKAKALEQFVKIEALNPDNSEVKKIVANLRAGKPALDGISPPGPAPEKRKEAPVRR